MNNLRQEILNGEWFFVQDKSFVGGTCSVCGQSVYLFPNCYFGHIPKQGVSGCLLCHECMEYFSKSVRLRWINKDLYIDEATKEFRKSLDEFKKRII